MATTFKQLRITHPDGRQNYGPLSVRKALELQNEILIANGRPELCMLLEEAEMTQEEFDAEPAINPNFVPNAKAKELLVDANAKIEDANATIEELKAQIAALQAAKGPAAKGPAAKGPAAKTDANSPDAGTPPQQ